MSTPSSRSLSDRELRTALSWATVQAARLSSSSLFCSSSSSGAADDVVSSSDPGASSFLVLVVDPTSLLPPFTRIRGRSRRRRRSRPWRTLRRPRPLGALRSTASARACASERAQPRRRRRGRLGRRRRSGARLLGVEIEPALRRGRTSLAPIHFLERLGRVLLGHRLRIMPRCRGTRPTSRSVADASTPTLHATRSLSAPR